MSEFQGFSDILKQFSAKQKFMVLLVLLCFSALIALGTTFMNGYYKSSEELTIIVNSQKKSIIDLNKRVNELQLSIINESKSCTDSILASEKRHADEILSQQKYVNDMLNKLKGQIIQRSQYNRVSAIEPYSGSDSSYDDPSKPRVARDEPVMTQQEDNTNEMIESINYIQKKMKAMNRK